MSAPDPNDHEAAAWVLREDRGLTAAEQDAFSQWLASDPAHGTALARQRRHWARLDAMAEWRPAHASRPNRDLLAPARPRWAGRIVRFVVFPIAAAAALVLGLRLAGNRPAPAAPLTASAGPFSLIEQRSLSDGTIVELNRGSRLEVLYSAGERRIRLDRGEVHFTVAKDASRPFIVTAAGVEVRAVGTAFDVSIETDRMSVLVTEGRVQAGGAAFVSAGQRALLPLPGDGAGGHVTEVSAADAARALAWRPEMLDLTGAPLSDFVAAFNRHNPGKIVLADPELAHLKLTARMRSDNVQGFVRLLERAFDLRVERSADTLRLHRAP